MQVQKHARISNIRKLSRYFLFLNVLTMIVVGIGAIALPIIVMLASSGDLTVMGYLSKAVVVENGFFSQLREGLSTELKVVAVLASLFFFGMIELVLIHINQLLTCFHEGEIFNKKAVFHAKRAFNINLVLVAIMFVVELIAIALSYVYPGHEATGSFTYFLGKSFDQLIWLGACLLLLWSLEIGVDLNEEAELTI
ncbi:hypothetical protein UNDYM_5132 [Undibacterium sp. YM2]|uniref:DUF2975 domain-containing protein n=1 Tax=Undibacterium sp. YM2 TaxID=2058625 RepID=UPI001331E332|nr:DUF2975 domain-containing protein [Undibacterium sp. YM2]BBB69385.1 hypothetical protein UNDYM_5132 [Undibacterium sp. YM2]